MTGRRQASAAREVAQHVAEWRRAARHGWFEGSLQEQVSSACPAVAPSAAVAGLRRSSLDAPAHYSAFTAAAAAPLTVGSTHHDQERQEVLQPDPG